MSLIAEWCLSMNLKNVLLSIAVLILSVLLFSGCTPESSGPSYSEFSSNRIPVALPDTLDVDVYRIEIVTDSTEPFVYYEKPGSDGLYISVPSDQVAQITIEGYKNELLVYSAIATINAGQKDAVHLDPNNPEPVFSPNQISAILTDENSIQLTWSSCAGASAYLIYKTDDTLSTPQKIQTTSDTTFSENLSDDTPVYYQVKAQYPNGISEPTKYVTIVSEIPIIPTPLSTVSNGVLSDSTIYLSWQPSSGATGYNIYRSEVENGEYSLVSSITDTMFTSTLNTGKMYYFKVSVKIKDKESALSTVVKVQVAKASLKAPKGVAASLQGTGIVKITFQAVEGANEYIIYKGTSESSTKPVDTISTLSYTDAAVTESATYYYKVIALANNQQSDPSEIVSISTGKSSPSIPTGLIATSPTATSTNLQFNASSNATGYIIYRGLSATALSSIDTISSTSFEDKNLSQNTTYYYAVAATNGTEKSANSSVVTIKTGALVPSTPTGLVATAQSATSILLKFNSASNAESYAIFSGTSENATVAIDTITETSFTSSSLQSGTTYYFAVSAINKEGISPRSQTVSAKTQLSAPATPTGLTATAASTSSIQIKFNTVSGATGYIIYRGTSSGSLLPVDTITESSLTDLNLQPATTYYYAVAAYNAGGVSQRSATASAATQDSPPATPSGLKVSATTANSITIQFNAVTGATGYKIYSSTNNSTFTLLATITTTTYTNTGLAAATTRYYKVSSIKGTTESVQSSSVSGTTTATVTKKAVVTASLCTGCGDCRVCPTGALTIVNRKAVIDASKCDGCGKCIARCRRGALKLQ